MVKETNSQYLFFEFQSQRVNLGLSFLHDFLVSLVSYFLSEMRIDNTVTLIIPSIKERAP